MEFVESGNSKVSAGLESIFNEVLKLKVKGRQGMGFVINNLKNI